MTETATGANKGKTTKHAAPSVAIPEYGLPKFEMPKFEMPNMEMPEAFREMAEKGVERTKEACAKAKVASEEAADLLENTYEAAVKHATDYNLKLFECAELLILRRHGFELLAHLRGRQLDKLRRRLHTQQLIGIVKGCTRVGTDNSADSE
jgi:hypothetical protein